MCWSHWTLNLQIYSVLEILLLGSSFLCVKSLTLQLGKRHPRIHTLTSYLPTLHLKSPCSIHKWLHSTASASGQPYFLLPLPEVPLPEDSKASLSRFSLVTNLSLHLQARITTLFCHTNAHTDFYYTIEYFNTCRGLLAMSVYPRSPQPSMLKVPAGLLGTFWAHQSS